MNDAAYDISHLLELEAVAPAMPEFRPARAVRSRPDTSNVETAQQMLASELLQMEAQHEEMIRQYMSMKGDAELAADW